MMLGGLFRPRRRPWIPTVTTLKRKVTHLAAICAFTGEAPAGGAEHEGSNDIVGEAWLHGNFPSFIARSFTYRPEPWSCGAGNRRMKNVAAFLATVRSNPSAGVMGCDVVMDNDQVGHSMFWEAAGTSYNELNIASDAECTQGVRLNAEETQKLQISVGMECLKAALNNAWLWPKIIGFTNVDEAMNAARVQKATFLDLYDMFVMDLDVIFFHVNDLF